MRFLIKISLQQPHILQIAIFLLGVYILLRSPATAFLFLDHVLMLLSTSQTKTNTTSTWARKNLANQIIVRKKTKKPSRGFRHECSPVNLLHIFRAPFPKNTSGQLLLSKVMSVLKALPKRISDVTVELKV